MSLTAKGFGFWSFTGTRAHGPAECADLGAGGVHKKREVSRTEAIQHAHSTTGGGLADLIEAPLGGSTAAQSFWSREGCDKEGSLEEESLEI